MKERDDTLTNTLDTGDVTNLMVRDRPRDGEPYTFAATAYNLAGTESLRLYRLTLPADQAIDLVTSAGPLLPIGDTVLGIYDTRLNYLIDNDDTFAFYSRLAGSLVAGSYLVGVQPYPGSTGDYSLNAITGQPYAAQPAGFGPNQVAIPSGGAFNTYELKSYLIYGRPEADWGRYYPLSLADVILMGKPEIGVAGYDNAWLGDFNGDHIDDYLTAAYGGRNNEHIPGEVYILLGTETPVPSQYLTDTNQALQDVPIRFTGEYWEPKNWEDIRLVELKFDDRSGKGTGFLVQYDQENNEIYLYDNNSQSWLGPCTPEENGRLENGIVRVTC